MNELALFAGAGGGILGGHLLGWRCVCAVEYDHYARSVLVARQNDGCLPPFPIWDDVRTFDGRPWRGAVDVVSGGFPCQDISAAGKGAGIGGSRSGLWSEMARIVGEVQPRYVWVENSPLLVRRGLGLVLSDLAALGFSARWGVVGAHHAGAPHKRDRIWVLAYANGKHDAVRGDTTAVAEEVACRGVEPRGSKRNRRKGRARGTRQGSEVAYADCGRCEKRDAQERRVQVADTGGHVPDAVCNRSPAGVSESQERQEGVAGESYDCSASGPSQRSWWGAEPDVGRVAHGVAARVDRLRCIGNGQVPRVVQRAWEELNT